MTAKYYAGNGWNEMELRPEIHYNGLDHIKVMHSQRGGLPSAVWVSPQGKMGGAKSSIRLSHTESREFVQLLAEFLERPFREMHLPVTGKQDCQE